MFRQKKPTERKSFAEKIDQRLENRISRDLGNQLRHAVGYWNDDKIMQGIALEMIDRYRHDPIVINAQGQMLWSPIFKSVARRHPEITHALMQAPGLDVNLRNIYGMNILMFAMQEYEPDHELIQYLLARTDLDFTTKTYTSDSNIFSADLRSKPRFPGASALYFATTSPKLYQYIPALLDLVGDEVNDYVKCKDHGSYGDFKVQRSPLTNLVTAVTKDKDHRQLLLPCITRIANTVSVNLSNKPHPQPRDEALYIAASAGDKEVVKILLQAGANKEYKGDRGLTAATVAKYKGHTGLAAYIQSYATSPKLQQEAAQVSAYELPPPAPQPKPSAPPNDALPPDASAPPLADVEQESECSHSPARLTHY